MTVEEVLKLKAGDLVYHRASGRKAIVIDDWHLWGEADDPQLELRLEIEFGSHITLRPDRFCTIETSPEF